MQRGNWVPIDKGLVFSLPSPGSREYSEVEAAFCVTVDYDNGKLVSQNGYATLWKWSRGRVKRFAEKRGWSISEEVPRGLNKLQIDREKEGCVIHDPTWKKRTTDDTTGGQPADNRRTTDDTTGGQPVNINNRHLHSNTDNRRTTDDTTGGQPADNRRTTDDTLLPILDPEPNPKKKKTERQKVMDLKPDWWSKEQWAELINHRKKKGAVLTVRAYESLLKEFELAKDAGESAENILNDMSSGNGWAGYKIEWAMKRKAGQINNRRKGAKNGKETIKKDYRTGATKDEDLPECLRPK